MTPTASAHTLKGWPEVGEAGPAGGCVWDGARANHTRADSQAARTRPGTWTLGFGGCRDRGHFLSCLVVSCGHGRGRGLRGEVLWLHVLSAWTACTKEIMGPILKPSGEGLCFHLHSGRAGKVWATEADGGAGGGRGLLEPHPPREAGHVPGPGLWEDSWQEWWL